MYSVGNRPSGSSALRGTGENSPRRIILAHGRDDDELVIVGSDIATGGWMER